MIDSGESRTIPRMATTMAAIIELSEIDDVFSTAAPATSPREAGLSVAILVYVQVSTVDGNRHCTSGGVMR